MLVFHTYIYTWTLKKEKNGITILVLSDTTHINKFVNLKFYSVVPKQCTEKLFYQSKKKKKTSYIEQQGSPAKISSI